MRYEDRHSYSIPLPSVDWQRVMLNIRRHVPLAQLKRVVKMDDRTIQRIARGEVKEPKFAQGVAILHIHKRLCEREHMEFVYDKA